MFDITEVYMRILQLTLTKVIPTPHKLVNNEVSRIFQFNLKLISVIHQHCTCLSIQKAQIRRNSGARALPPQVNTATVGDNEMNPSCKRSHSLYEFFNRWSRYIDFMYALNISIPSLVFENVPS